MYTLPVPGPRASLLFATNSSGACGIGTDLELVSIPMILVERDWKLDSGVENEISLDTPRDGNGRICSMLAGD